ncbi:hypothetical protein B0H12DRAFT_1137172 [Mycena haematopus]|nr:hypothetical protein B0H12DRAFT_1137172 [Mycena haematopus]
MNAQHLPELVRRLSATPERYIEAARSQSAPGGLAALLDLSSVWADVPQTIELGAVDVFLSHLRAEQAPALTRTPRRWQRDADFAYLSLVALGEMEPLIKNPRYHDNIGAVVEGWPGIVKWCSYIYDARVDSDSAQERQVFFDSIVKLFYMVSRFNQFIVVMAETSGCLELVTKLWVLEDIPAGVDGMFLGPVSTYTLGTLIEFAGSLGKPDAHERMITAAGGDIDFIVQLVLGRVKKANQAINLNLGSLALSWHIDLIVQLCQPHPHPLRQAFFDADVISIVTNSFVALSHIIAQNSTPHCISMMISCFDFFARYLEGDDYFSPVHAVKARFIPAFLDCSPAFSQLVEENLGKVLDIMFKNGNRKIKYAALRDADHAAHDRNSMAFIRKLLTEGSPASCDYVKCQIMDVKYNFKKCAACKAVYYCSPECQKLAWKSSHRAICKDKKAERTGQRDTGGRPKSDRAALHGLVQWVAQVNFAAFHAIAERDFADTPREDLMPCIDFCCVPEEYSVKVIKPGASAHPGVDFSPSEAVLSEARFQTAVSQWRAIPDTTIIQSIVEITQNYRV